MILVLVGVAILLVGIIIIVVILIFCEIRKHNYDIRTEAEYGPTQQSIHPVLHA
jgi:hypothetical protein